MPLELAELAAGLPFAASFAMAGGISALREARRRTALNEAVHELRRPLQAIALAAPVTAERGRAFESSLQMAAAAVDRLDREINGGPEPETIEVAPLREIVEATIERWVPRASGEDRSLSLEWEAGDPHLSGDAVELTQVLDNLISNGLDHGSGAVSVRAAEFGGAVRLAVVNRKRVGAGVCRRSTRGLWGRLSGRSRHGHGLRLVRRIAARNGGSFRLRQSGDRCEALLDLPLSGRSR